MANGDFAAELDRAAQVAERHRAELLRIPGVVAVGPGPQRTRGRPTGRAAVVVTVRRKAAPEELAEAGARPLPGELDGVPVDVVELGAPAEPLELRREIEEAVRAKDAVAEEWLRRPNVTGVGVGYRVQGGKTTGEVVVQVFVEEKVGPDEVERRGWTQVPRELHGVRTDVVRMAPPRENVPPSGSRGDRRDPLVGGLSVGHASSPFSYGTLAAVAFDASNQPVALSNEHVLDGDIGETVHQPSPVGLDDSLEVSFQLDVCNPLNFVRLDTPDTTAGSILAGAAAAAALAAALSDEIDPTREGQEATPPPAGALTLEEYTRARIDYRQFPLPGMPFELKAGWRYERRTDLGVREAHAERKRKNPHTLLFSRLFTDYERYDPSGNIGLLGVVIPPEGSQRSCCAYHCVAFLRPLHQDRSYPVVLRCIEELGVEPGTLHSRLLERLQKELPREELELVWKNLRRACFYVGGYPAAGLPLGPWRHWMYVQTVNDVPPGTDPLVAAQTIGGLPASTLAVSQLDVACGPFVWEDDGSFDIELLSI